MIEIGAAAIAIAGAVAAWVKSRASKVEADAAIAAAHAAVASALAKASDEAVKRSKELGDELDTLREDLAECVQTKRAILLRVSVLESEIAALKATNAPSRWTYKTSTGD